jgi:hypothetical protein
MKVLLFLLAMGISARADLLVAPQILAPKTPAESWNVLRLATDNVARLISEKRLLEVPAQISLCSPALRTLASSYTAPEHSELLNASTARAAALINTIARTSMAEQPTAQPFAQLRTLLDQLKPAFPADIVAAEIYTCPQHPEHLTTDPIQLCPTCKAKPRIRCIPYSDIYITGQPTTKLTLQGQIVQLSTADLIPTHNSSVRLLIIDPTFTDFRSLIATPTAKPDEWAIPIDLGTRSYRLWAHLTPAATALAEHPHADLGPAFVPEALSPDRAADTLSTTLPGIKAQLAFSGGTGGPPSAQQICLARLQLTDDKDQPITTLQPHSQAFAHLTCIYADASELIQLHPTGGDILNESALGGPTLSFKTYFPRPGNVRVFCQIKLQGKILTLPFSINIKGP